ncbi:histidine--tRNA ligase [Candidatus Synchoanobacter obligatus]|uniref:Histidine--tRNA ligase n=1 Tax=Candidatus Synchoanobacter obligatus TaxID=2919597 RepID=A0ABT1L406_9GAMM|nr:histidine--tRNA ligase [Candidatus Synchoanobacter obligatus]MCP8351859.1 histidine--tRNA ligase [Candidatus Synchoanobacter obligatus]
MSNKYQCLRGMRDLSLEQSGRISYIERTLERIAQQYGYANIQFPILEEATLFQKSIGIETDIVGQEMYTFQDKNDQLISLRPEGTAGCLRACLANGMIQRQKQKVYYQGPMFRRERPQRGRFRQFQHFGIEVYGYPSGGIDAELILMSHQMWQSLGLNHIQLHVNYLGSPASRVAYRDTLQAYWKEHTSELTEDERQRAENNPLRLLDSKNPSIQSLIDHAPSITESLSDDEKQCYQKILDMLSRHHISYIESKKLVRGLDYYSDFIFEWISDDLGSQSTICGGGRYDPLVAAMGHDIPAIGFAAGVDRIEEIMPKIFSDMPKILFCAADESLLTRLERLQQARSNNIILDIDYSAGKLKNKMKTAQHKAFDYIAYLQEDDQIKVIHFTKDESHHFNISEFNQWCQSLATGDHYAS